MSFTFRKWYDVPSTTTRTSITREVRFPALVNPLELCRGRPWSYSMPLFQQMKEMACKKVSLGTRSLPYKGVQLEIFFFCEGKGEMDRDFECLGYLVGLD